MQKLKKVIMIFFYLFIGIYIVVALGFYLKQESILFHPVKTAENFKYSFDANFKEKFYDTPNNGKINTLRFYANNSKGIVYYLHGNAGNLEDWAWVYPQFINRGYDVEILDYRTYGKSTGKLSEENMYGDVQYVYNEILKEYSEENVIVFGRSIGTGMAVKVSADNNPKTLILESPYYNIYDIAKTIAPFLPLKLMLKYRFKSNENILKVKAPIYILHGKQDRVIPFESGKKLFKLVENKAAFIEFEIGTHSNLATFRAYGKMLDKVLVE